MSNVAFADTLTIQLSGSALTGLTGNPSISYTLSDADVINIVAWATAAFSQCLNANYQTGPLSNPVVAATNAQALACWTQNWANGTKNAVQQFLTTPPVLPAPIGVAPGTGAPTK